jgi:DNA-binding SARP family transcriptional activator
VEFRVLGSVGIVDADQLLPVGGEKPRRLLAVLLAHRNSVVSADRLVDALWADPPDAAGATLQSYISRLRRFVELGDDTSLRNRAPGYVLEVPEHHLDAGRFERKLADAEPLLDADPYAALDALEAALAEWRGPAFAEFADAEWIRPEAIRLDELRVVTIERRIEAELRIGRHEQVVGELEALLVDHPLRERFGAQLMLALYRSGRQAESLRAANELRSRLRDEFGLEPSATIRDLEAAILAEHADLAWVAPAVSPHRDALASGRGARRTVPAESTPLVGRERGCSSRAGFSRCSGPVAWARRVSRCGSRPHSPISSPTGCASWSSRRCATRARFPPRSATRSTSSNG